MDEAKILHIAPDEKFIDAAYYLFEKAFPGSNHFVIVKPAADPAIRFLGQAVKNNAEFIVRSSDTNTLLEKMSKRHSVTVFHGIDNLKGAVFLNSFRKDRFMTIVFGAEIYNSNIIKDQVIGEKTRDLYDTAPQKTLYEVLKRLYRKIMYRKVRDYDYVDIKDVLYEMKVLGSLPSFSYNRLINEGVYNPEVKKVPFSYYPLEFIIKDEELKVSGRDILLGNSASETNNHVEALDLLENCNLDDHNIFTPLSYGNKKYAEFVISYGKDLFPNNFKALTKFLSLEEYNKVLSRCGIVIMNHYRPQGMGNIIASLYMGAKVLLNDTDGYRYFRDLGCHIFLIEEELSANNNKLFCMLTEKQVLHNRKVLEKELSTSNLVQKIQASFKEIFDFP